MSTPTVIEPTELPATIRTYLAAHAAGEADAAIRTFSLDAAVTDQGRTFRGTSEVLDFLRHAGAEFTYTTEVVGAERLDDAHWVAVVRLEGDFPGGVAEVRYRFTMASDAANESGGGLIAELVIAP